MCPALADLEFEKEILMRNMGKVVQRPLTPEEIQEIMSEDGWDVVGGVGVNKKRETSPVIGFRIVEGSFRLLTGQTYYALSFGDWVTQPSPHILHVYRAMDQECDRPKELGGGKWTRQLPTVLLVIRNDALKQRLKKQADEAEAEALERRTQQEAKRREQIAAQLGLANLIGMQVTGFKIVSITTAEYPYSGNTHKVEVLFNVEESRQITSIFSL